MQKAIRHRNNASTTANCVIHTKFSYNWLQNADYSLLPALKYDSVLERSELNVADNPALIPLALSEMFVFNISPVTTALFLMVVAFSEQLSFKVKPVLTALSLSTAAVSFSRKPVLYAPLASTDPLCLAVSFSTETVFTVPALTDDADEASDSLRLSALDQRLEVKSVGGAVSVSGVGSCDESTRNATQAEIS